MKIKGWDLSFFNSGEWQVCNERLQDLERQNKSIGRDGFYPRRSCLFRALQLTPLEEVRVCILGQDPYPSGTETTPYATGVAFSIPSNIPGAQYPRTLKMFLEEYSTDLGVPLPSNGNLEQWSSSGVLLLNAIPSCKAGTSLSHDWDEWRYLTREVIGQLSKKGIVFALLGQVAHSYSKLINPANNYVITTSHPSPRGSINSRSPFTGSRLFSTINARLVDNGQEPIDWRLP